MRLLKKLVLLVFFSQNSHPSYHFANLVVGKTGIQLGLRQNCETLCFLPLFVPITRGSLDYARDDVFFGGSSFKNFQSSFINRRDFFKVMIINLEMVLLIVQKGLNGAKYDLSVRKFYFFIKFYLT